MAGPDIDVGEHVEALLAQLRRQGGEQAGALGDELVRLLVNFYGDGLERVVDIVGAEAPELLGRLAADPLVEAQLILHGLHPLSVEERIEAALDRVRPYLGSHAGGVAYLGVDDDGVAHLRLDGSCNGCPSSTVTVKLTIEEALLNAVPEVTAVAVQGETKEAAPLLQIGMRPGAEPVPGHAPAANATAWRHPSAQQLPASGFASSVVLDGQAVLVARLGQTLYAYTDRCAVCSDSLVGDAGAVLDGDVLTCAACSARFDVRLAGRAADRSGRRLNPLPLLDDVSGVRIAVVPDPVAV